MAEVEISHLFKTYSGTTAPATRDITLTVADGEFLVLLGPSGCGKTTLLRMIAGLELPDSGTVRIGGADVTYRPPRERNLSMVFQSYAVFPHKKVVDNIGFGLAMRKTDKAVIREKVEWAAGLLRLEDYLDRYPAQLSGGQRQRVAVARAIVMEPDVLLMDEPLSNLDALLRLEFRAELKKLLTELGTTCVYVTHDQVEALSLGERVAVMKDGEIVQSGPPLDVYDSPASVFVGGFIGSPPMNFLDGTLRRTGDRAYVEVGAQRMTAPAAWSRLPEGPVRVGIRAETITAHRAEHDGGLRAVAEVAEPLGSTTLVTALIGDQRLKVQVPPEFPVDPGDELWLKPRPERTRCYDPESGRVMTDA
ncbi:ABC transporter ATP-binding protein [Spirillospora sp. CA-142024]|uniref:ABC transporter ATP-binding protein n=1 Tax=Spirillospora sp. CA-142024 TaxID=3240036 RepID=UPI003D8E93C1